MSGSIAARMSTSLGQTARGSHRRQCSVSSAAVAPMHVCGLPYLESILETASGMSVRCAVATRHEARPRDRKATSEPRIVPSASAMGSSCVRGEEAKRVRVSASWINCGALRDKSKRYGTTTRESRMTWKMTVNAWTQRATPSVNTGDNWMSADRH